MLLVEVLVVFLRCMCCIIKEIYNYVIICHAFVFENQDSQLWEKGDVGLKTLSKIPIILNLNWKY